MNYWKHLGASGKFLLQVHIAIALWHVEIGMYKFCCI